MNIFLFMEKNQSALLMNLSKFISNFFNPIISLLLFLGYFSYKKLTADEILISFSLVICIVVLPITAWIAWNVKTKRYSNADVSDRKQRKTLYAFTLLTMSILLAVLLGLDGNKDFTTIILFLIILLIMMQMSNFYIKSSMHTCFNLFVAGLFFPLNQTLSFIWLIVTILVGISRLILRRHSLKEVLAGSIIALYVSVSYIYFISFTK